VNIKALPFFQHVKWRPDAGELRRFAIAMLIGFFVLGAVPAWWARGIGTGTVVLWGIGVSLAGAAFIPGFGRIAYLAVYLPTSIIGYVVSQVMLTLMFFLVVTPLAIILRWQGKDVLQRRRKNKPEWMPVKGVKNEESYYRQF
jgi:hypothetical protein